ncbi:divalent-cation tolerance protein CutA [Novosphingobium sp. PC22D]|nr:divalent-cation tolerance protein CutA [Novosphingobium sp. PC22D]
MIWAPFPDIDSASRAVTWMLEHELAACGNIVSGVRSLFVWKGQTQSADEVVAVLKTNGDLLAAAVDRLAELHPYEDPAVVGWRCDAAAPATRAWLAALGT